MYWGPNLPADELAHFGDGVVRDARRIGTHVGDETDRAFAAQFHAFIELLRQHHGALHAEAQLARRFLLQGGRDERSDRIAALFLRADRFDDVLRAFEIGDQRIRDSPDRESPARLRPCGTAGRRSTGFFFAARLASSVQYSCLTNARISRSRSTMTRTATVCTRPAERPRRTLSQSSGEIL